MWRPTAQEYVWICIYVHTLCTDAYAYICIYTCTMYIYIHACNQFVSSVDPRFSLCRLACSFFMLNAVLNRCLSVIPTNLFLCSRASFLMPWRAGSYAVRFGHPVPDPCPAINCRLRLCRPIPSSLPSLSLSRHPGPCYLPPGRQPGEGEGGRGKEREDGERGRDAGSH